jgi:putative transposase
MIEAFPKDCAPRFMVRDRDGIYGESFRSRVEGIGIEEVCTTPRSLWQNCYVERVIGSIRRECLNHMIVLNDNHLRRLLRTYFRYYHESRTHLSLNKDAPQCRAIQSNKSGRIVQIPQVRGLHHQIRAVPLFDVFLCHAFLILQPFAQEGPKASERPPIATGPMEPKTL